MPTSTKKILNAANVVITNANAAADIVMANAKAAADVVILNANAAAAEVAEINESVRRNFSVGSIFICCQ